MTSCKLRMEQKHLQHVRESHAYVSACIGSAKHSQHVLVGSMHVVNVLHAACNKTFLRFQRVYSVFGETVR